MNKLTEQDFEKFEEWARDNGWDYPVARILTFLVDNHVALRKALRSNPALFREFSLVMEELSQGKL